MYCHISADHPAVTLQRCHGFRPHSFFCSFKQTPLSLYTSPHPCPSTIDSPPSLLFCPPLGEVGGGVGEHSRWASWAGGWTLSQWRGSGSSWRWQGGRQNCWVGHGPHILVASSSENLPLLIRSGGLEKVHWGEGRKTGHLSVFYKGTGGVTPYLDMLRESLVHRHGDCVSYLIQYIPGCW